MKYQLVQAHNGEVVAVFEPSVGCIPIQPDNTDYQQYLKWLEEGNQPLPADQPEQGGV